jgi:hypothetical protein
MAISRQRLVGAFAVAAIADCLSILVVLAAPVQWAIDLATAILLLVVLGWQWALLPGLVMEAIPGLDVFPFWILAVGAVARWGSRRKK